MDFKCNEGGVKEVYILQAGSIKKLDSKPKVFQHSVVVDLEPEDEIINFAVWYSGMTKEKVKRAYDRYKSEQPTSP